MHQVVVTVGTVHYELELKGERARAVSHMLADGNIDAAFGVVRSVIEFREPCADTNRARWPVAAWWRDMVGEAKTILRTVRERVAASVERLEGWFDRQVTPALHAFIRAAGRERLDRLIAGADFRAVRRYPAVMSLASAGSG